MSKQIDLADNLYYIQSLIISKPNSFVSLMKNLVPTSGALLLNKKRVLHLTKKTATAAGGKSATLVPTSAIVL